MQSKARLAGHPLHQMLVPIPFGLLVMATLFDVTSKISGHESLASVSYWNLIVGIGAGLLAAVFGVIDWRAIPGGTRAKRVGLLHAVGNVIALGLFFTAWMLRGDTASHAPGTGALVLEIVAFAIAGGTGWLGGELVDRLGVGVDEGANINAPSSLSGKPARL